MIYIWICLKVGRNKMRSCKGHGEVWSYVTAGDSQVQEVTRTVTHHVLKRLDIQTEVLQRNVQRVSQVSGKYIHPTLYRE